MAGKVQLNEELYAILGSKATKSDVEALRRLLLYIQQNVDSSEFYLKPLSGIPLKDMSAEVKALFDKLNSVYKQGEKIASEDLPENVITTEKLGKATTGLLNYFDTCSNIIDEVVEARQGELGITLLGNLNRKLNKAEVIAGINASSESVKISKTKMTALDHADVGLRDAAACHPATAISYIKGLDTITVSAELDALATAVALKANVLTIVDEINMYSGLALIDGALIDATSLLAGLTHNSLGDRDADECHPASAIEVDIGNSQTEDLQTYLNNLPTGGGLSGSQFDVVIGGNAGIDGWYDPLQNYGTIDDRIRCLEAMISQMALMFNPPMMLPPCIIRPPGWL